MKSVVHQFVQDCMICQKAKPDRAKTLGLLHPLPIPDSAWKIITMDFVDGLPQSRSANCIMVVVDKFTKYSHFIPLKHPYTAQSVAKQFLNQVYKLSDRNSVFTSNFWKELFCLANVQLRLSSAYHHQSDGQSERVNQCMETYLRCFVSACPKKWIEWLPLAEFWYNTSTHSAISRPPFEALYGHLPRHFGVSDASHTSVDSLDDWLQDRHLMTSVIKQHLQRAVLKMKHQTDKNRSER
jgi:hypothetical protein